MSILKANRIENLTTTDGGINVNNSGKVGIGTTANSDSQLHVKSGANDGDPVLRLEAATNNFLNFRQTGSVYDIRVTAGDPLSFTIGSSEKARVTSNGLTFNGDTAAANALGDYEEGTFTPRLVIENVGDVTIYTNKKGSYVKVGSTVTVWFNLTVDGTPSGRSTSNAIEFQDLPFTSTGDDSDGSQYYIGSIRINTVNTGSTYGDFSEAILRLNNNSVMGRIELREASTSILRNSSLWLTDNTSIHGTITYRTDS